MSNTLHRSRTRGSKVKLRTHTTRTTIIELIQCNNIQDTAAYTSSPPRTRTTLCRNIIPPTIITTRS